MGSPLGIRADLSYAHQDEGRGYHADRPRPEVMNVNLDLKLKSPALSQRFPLSLYAIGGGTYTRYKDLLIQLDEPTAGTVGLNVAPSDHEWHDKYGFNGGIGGSLGWGKTELFVEGRLVSFRAANAGDARQFPLIIGFNWY
jgi:hypothetical protein